MACRRVTGNKELINVGLTCFCGVRIFQCGKACICFLRGCCALQCEQTLCLLYTCTDCRFKCLYIGNVLQCRANAYIYMHTCVLLSSLI